MAVCIPLFPLDEVVLFPNVLLPLHIHEPRYQRMMRACLAGDRRFGVALLREGAEVGGLGVPHNTGTMAHIREYRELDEGQLVLLAIGEHRFRVLAVREVDERLEADVEYFDDDPVSAEGIGSLQRDLVEAATAHSRLVREAIGAAAGEPQLPDDPRHLGFFLATNLPLEPLERQQLLEITDTAERLRWLRNRLVHETDVLAKRLEIREEVERVRSGNGKLKHEDHLDPDVLGSLDN